MLITNKLRIDLVNQSSIKTVRVVQCDANTRAVAVTLVTGSVPWEPPEGAVASVAFTKPDGNKGWYDQLPDGSSACTVAGNVVTAILAPEMLTTPGRIKAFIVFQDADLNQISTFGFTVEVDPSATAGNAVSNSYYKYSTMEAVSAAMEAHDETIADLEEAMANGEFKGEKGDKGDKGEAPDAVLYTEQTLTDEQQAQARGNIGAAVADDVKPIYNLFEFKNDNNILNPANSESGYYTGTVGNPIEKTNSNNHLRTITPIPVEAGQKLYVRTNIPPDEYRGLCVCVFVAEDGTFIKQTNWNSTWVDPYAYFEAPSGAKFAHIFTDTVSYGRSFENWCITFEWVDEFQSYSPHGTAVLKDESLPKELFENNRPLAGKTIVNFGDSIFGKRRPPNDISTELARLTGATVHNCGFGGCRMASHSMTNYDAFSMYRLADAIVSGDWSLQDAGIADTTQSETVQSYFAEGLAILKDLDFSNVDIITIAYGTNDFTASVNMENENVTKDTNTFAGALRYSVETLLNAYPHLKIFVCSQTYRFWMDSSNVFTDDSDTHTNSNGVKLTDFVAKTEEVSKAYHLPYINNYDIGMNKHNRSQYFSTTDGTHPLTTGCHLIAAHIAKELF